MPLQKSAVARRSTEPGTDPDELRYQGKKIADAEIAQREPTPEWSKPTENHFRVSRCVTAPSRTVIS